MYPDIDTRVHKSTRVPVQVYNVHNGCSEFKLKLMSAEKREEHKERFAKMILIFLGSLLEAKICTFRISKQHTNTRLDTH